MPPKKGPPAKPKKRAIPRELDEEGNEIIEEEEYPRFYLQPRWLNFPVLRNTLEAAQREIDETSEELPALIRRHIELLEAGDDAALATWLAKDGANVTSASRRRAHDARTVAQSHLEDFLHFQTVEHRWARLWSLKGGAQKDSEYQKKPVQRAKKHSYMFPSGEKDKFLERLLDRYDSMQYGSAAHRAGEMDPSARDKHDDDAIDRGEEKGKGKHAKQKNVQAGLKKGAKVASELESEHERERVMISPRQLRLWPPLPRRDPVGLRGPDTALSNHGTNLDGSLLLDTDALWVEQQRVEHDRLILEAHRDSSHSVRREAELERFRGEFNASSTNQTLRPESSGFVVTATSGGQISQDRFHNIRTDHGLFVAALESSRDWRTSYDFLGPIKDGYQVDFQTSFERDLFQSDPGSSEDLGDVDVLIEGKKRKGVPMSLQQINPQEVDSSKKRISKKTAKPLVDMADAGRVELDYPYEAHEFAIDFRQLEQLNRPVVTIKDGVYSTTKWAEESEGRREWHVDMQYSPVSSVDSPPRTPVDPNAIDPESIPEGLQGNNTKALENRQKRCPHSPQTCRAWWVHPSADCWIMQSNPAPLRQSPTSDPLGTMEKPRYNVFSDSGKAIYDGRITDHYGIRGKDSPDEWPMIGVRVPYEPMTLDDLKLRPEHLKIMEEPVINTVDTGDTLKTAGNYQSSGNPGLTDASQTIPSTRICAPDADRRHPFEASSLSIPLIPLTSRISDSSQHTSDDDDASSDEGDLFNFSYHENTSQVG